MTEEQIFKTVEFIKSKGVTSPQVGIILGTGLGGLTKEIVSEIEIEYHEIPNFPIATVEFHKSRLIYGKLNGVQVIAFQGRFHFYEGYDMHQITLPVKVMKLLGVKNLLVSNAAGTMNPDFKKGELMLLTDHINLLPEHPLRGKNNDDFGPRFPDMSEPYSKKINGEIDSIAKEKGITVYKGVYAVAMGPCLETRAEYRYLRKIGADAVGMSTVPEVIVANHMGLPCCAVSVLTDECDPDNLQPVDIADIIETAGKAEVKLTTLFSELVTRI